METCGFCGREFGSSQSVKAHLRHCTEYAASGQSFGQGAIGTVPNRRDAIGGSSLKIGPETRTVSDKLGAERLRLDLRHVQHEHARLDAEERERLRQAEEQETAERELQRQAERDRVFERERQSERERRTQEAAELRARRREIITEVKTLVVDRESPKVPDRFKADALLRIEDRLSALLVDQYPKSELLLLARGIRDRVYEPWRRKQDRIRQDQARKEQLSVYGRDLARREVDQCEGIDFFTRQDFLNAVEAELKELDGSETRVDVRDLVEELSDESL